MEWDDCISMKPPREFWVDFQQLHDEPQEFEVRKETGSQQFEQTNQGGDNNLNHSYGVLRSIS